MTHNGFGGEHRGRSKHAPKAADLGFGFQGCSSTARCPAWRPGTRSSPRAKAHGYPVPLDVLPGSNHLWLSEEGWKVFLAAFSKAAAKD